MHKGPNSSITTPEALDHEHGATAVEYGLMLALISLGILAAVTGLATKVVLTLDQVIAAL